MTETSFPDWPEGTVSRIPYQIYTDADVYKRELERIFYGPHWSYVGLSVEVPGRGDYKETTIGERSVIMVRDADGAINVIENHCAHRGVRFCQERFGSVKSFICPYHQWNYDLKGNLTGVPFRRGFKGKGGMPDDFDTSKHNLNKLRVAQHNGLVFATFSEETENLLEYIGPKLLRWLERTFDGRELTLLGYSRQRIPGNWKLMQENIKDPYHPGLLHTWFVTFGLWRADQNSRMLMDEHGRHCAMVSARNAGGAGEATQNVASFKADMTLHDDRILDVVPEHWWNGPTVVMMTLFPSLIVQQQVNSLSTRQIQPRGEGVFEFVWTHFGFADDTPEMTRRRLRQANLFGPAGFVSADDGEVIEFSQQGFTQDQANATIAELGGRGVADTDHMVTEAPIRAMYQYYRGVMGL